MAVIINNNKEQIQWVRPFSDLVVDSGGALLVPLTNYATPFNAGRIAWDMPNTGASATFSISVFGRDY
jgi:hypothetical protein